MPALLGLAAQAQHATDDPAFAAAEEAARRFQLAPGLRLETWAAEPQLLNPVAFSLAPLPRAAGILPAPSSTALPVAAYVAETHRLGLSVPDITQNTPWLLNDLSLRTVPEREAFLLGTAFATNAALLTRDSEILRLVADTTGDGRADHSDVLADGFNSPVDGVAAGVLAQGTNVWFANIPNLWRFPASVQFQVSSVQTNAARPAGAEHLKLNTSNSVPLATGFGVHVGVIGHDLHGLIRGPDGRIYMSFGDRGVSITNREGVVIHLPDTGGVLRCEPDGAALEVFCLGLRNPQELAFDDFGNLFTVDNDTAGADPCRVLHLVEGGDYGWRASYQHMRGFGPWVQEGLWAGGLDGVLPPAGTVSQGPAGLAYHPGTGFGRFAGKFLHADFPGGIWAFSVQPHGASFAVAEKEKVLWNAWPTDVEFGP
ncbi:MAG TPA: PQQ-dependent sugar dehydrogenase, partial [Verrucomicrobiota bacterium]|nr:PQQ-dependent sugar dehydrogenase [Verrucomicrobiota bacterium]